MLCLLLPVYVSDCLGPVDVNAVLMLNEPGIGSFSGRVTSSSSQNGKKMPELISRTSTHQTCARHELVAARWHLSHTSVMIATSLVHSLKLYPLSQGVTRGNPLTVDEPDWHNEHLL